MKRRSDGIITLLEEVKREREGGGGEDAFYNTHYHYITLHLEIAHTIITLLHLFIAGRVRVVNAFFWWLGSFRVLGVEKKMTIQYLVL